MKRRTFLIGTSAMALVCAASPLAFAQPTEQELLEPGALPDKTFGTDDAPVTIIEYASLTCPHCRTFHIDVWPGLKEKYVDTGKVRFIMREFPFDPRSTAGFMLARCAGDEKVVSDPRSSLSNPGDMGPRLRRNRRHEICHGHDRHGRSRVRSMPSE